MKIHAILFLSVSIAYGKQPPDFVALGLGTVPEYSGSDEYQLIPFGAARYSTDFATFSWEGLSLSADLLAPRGNGSWMGGVTSRYRFDRDDTGNAAIDALGEIDAAIELGGFLGYQLRNVLNKGDSIAFKIKALFDVTDTHEGFTITPAMSYSWKASPRLFLSTSLSADYGSSDFLQTYYGVSEGATSLPAYSLGGGIQRASLSFTANYALNEDWGLVGYLSYSRLLDDVADSPIVVEENQALAGFAVSWRF